MLNVSVTKNNARKKNTFLYFMLLPFLFPRGFGEYFSWYHSLQRYMLAFATFIMFVYFIVSLSRKKIAINICACWVLAYHFVLLIETICIQGGVSEGIQKIFFAPVFFILCMEQIKKNWRYFLDVFSTLLIIIFVLNITVFNQWIFPNYFLVDRHVTFIGHVQIVAQMGLLSVLIGSIMLKEKRKKNIILITLGILNMIYSRTLVSFISLAILLFGILIIMKIKRRSFNNPIKFFTLPYLISIVLISITQSLKGFYFLGTINISISGRMFIWTAVLEKVKGHWIFGYGAFGTLFRVFWNDWAGNYSGSNYTHSEILQLLIDGGIVLVIIYFCMMNSCIKKLNICQGCKEKSITVLLLGVFSAIAIVESITEYYYYFGFLAIVSSLRLIIQDKEAANNRSLLKG